MAMLQITVMVPRMLRWCLDFYKFVNLWPISHLKFRFLFYSSPL